MDRTAKETRGGLGKWGELRGGNCGESLGYIVNSERFESFPDTLTPGHHQFVLAGTPRRTGDFVRVISPRDSPPDRELRVLRAKQSRKPATKSPPVSPDAANLSKLEILQLWNTAGIEEDDRGYVNGLSTMSFVK